MELVLVGIVAIALVGWLIFGVAMKVGRDQSKAERNSDKILNDVFNGSDDVAFALHMRTLKYDTVIVGAKQRGYRLASQALNEHGAGTLIFERVTARPDEP